MDNHGIVLNYVAGIDDARLFCRHEFGSVNPVESADDVAASMDSYPPEEVVMGRWRCEKHLPRDHIASLIDGMLASAAASCSDSAPASAHGANSAAHAADMAPTKDSAAAAPPIRVRLQTTKFHEIEAQPEAGEWVRSNTHIPLSLAIKCHVLVLTSRFGHRGHS